MTERTPLDEYAASVAPEKVPLLAALDAAVRSAGQPLDVAIKYRLLMYTLEGRYQNWVCAIGPTKRTLSLRFLYGDLLDFGSLPARSGSTTMRTLDFTSLDEIDPAAIARLVREAVAKHPDHLARERL